jgi:hypothetical protein
MILAPADDQACLGPVTDHVTAMVARRDPILIELARQLRTLAALAAFIRSLPQRNDESDLLDGPKIGACTPWQRLRIPAPDPNCFERASLYMAVGELIDPSKVRQLSTSETDNGPHTVCLEDGVAVNLDPMVPRNAVAAGLGAPPSMSLWESIEWTTDIAEEPAGAWPGGERRVRNARETLRGLQAGVAVTDDTMADVAFALALAAREATRWGAAGREIVRSVMRELCTLQEDATTEPIRDTPLPAEPAPSGIAGPIQGLPRNGMSDALRTVVRSAERVGTVASKRYGNVALAAAGMYLAGVGFTPAMLLIVEEELRREGLTVGALAKPAPKAGTTASVTPVGRAARAIAAQEPKPTPLIDRPPVSPS